ncbi:MAG: DUF6754 domain-containing protein [Planctomycetota bacterium]
MIRAAAFVLLAATAATAQAPADFKVYDRPGDAGGVIIAEWKGLPGEEIPETARRIEYVISVSLSKDGEWKEIKRFPGTLQHKNEAPEIFGFSKSNETEHFIALKGLVPPPGGPWLGTGKSLPTWVKLEVISPAGTAIAGPLVAEAKPNWWAWNKTNVFVFILIFGVVTFWLISKARRNPNIFVRRIPGLDAMEEAIGRATEMGRPILYLNGLQSMESISTIASVSILGQISKRVASYDSQILVPCRDAVVLSVCQEVMREGFTAAGRPDKYREQDAWFITQEQFSYVASVDGLMIREKPAACLYMGYYYAESLLLAETGGATGAIQIAGTDSITQLPFFIACCDYTLIGEELYAASAYLSREPLQLGSLRSQDAGKIFIIATLFLGALTAAAGYPFVKHLLATF